MRKQVCVVLEGRTDVLGKWELAVEELEKLLWRHALFMGTDFRVAVVEVDGEIARRGMGWDPPHVQVVVGSE